ncbi:MAG: acetylxylan esterase [Clostridia bacterium]|nr:acetylxylan esterase [Clostridia bacterium]
MRQIENIILGRNLPPLKSKEEMLDILLKEVYGTMPEKPMNITFSAEDEYDKANFLAGKAELKKIDITSTIKGKDFTFPAYLTIPRKPGKYPFFVVINFRSNIPDKYIPAEELIDNGFAVLSFNYEDVTSDDGDFENGLAGVIFENGKRDMTSPGKIAMWAWAAQRVMDYAETCDMLDKEKCMVCGHSRLGKTALLAAATDERFKMAYSNDSGCTGAALSRGKKGETVQLINETFPFWFAENYKKYSDNEDKLPLDQHYLIASIAPRPVYVASAKEDLWADPISEMLTLVAASEMYEKMGLSGFVCADKLPEAGDKYHEGNLGYHMRDGRHYLSRTDWNYVMEFFRKKFGI